MWTPNKINQSQTQSCDSEAHNCCTPQPKEKTLCPKCLENAKGVLGKTLNHLLTDDAKSTLLCLDGFYFCTTPACEVVYFRGDEILRQNDLSVVVGCKEGASPASVCYCFGWTKEKIKEELQSTGESSALEDIKAKMNSIRCSCEILNPSGGCCLGDVSKAIKELQ